MPSGSGRASPNGRNEVLHRRTRWVLALRCFHLAARLRGAVDCKPAGPADRSMGQERRAGSRTGRHPQGADRSCLARWLYALHRLRNRNSCSSATGRRNATRLQRADPAHVGQRRAIAAPPVGDPELRQQLRTVRHVVPHRFAARTGNFLERLFGTGLTRPSVRTRPARRGDRRRPDMARRGLRCGPDGGRSSRSAGSSATQRPRPVAGPVHGLVPETPK